MSHKIVVRLFPGAVDYILAVRCPGHYDIIGPHPVGYIVSSKGGCIGKPDRHTTLGSYVGYQTRVLADGETAQYRVVPVNEAGIDGSPRTFTVTMVRRPDPPDVDYTWDAETARVTLSMS